MPRARVQSGRSRLAYRFDLLDDEGDQPHFALGPSILREGSSALALPAPQPPLAAPRQQAPALGLQTSFADLAQELMSVSAADAAAAQAAAASASASASSWDLSAFSGGGAAAAGAGAAPLLLPGLQHSAGYKKHLVLDALHRAHDSEASAVSEKLHRQELSTRRRGRLLTSIVSGEAYRGRSAAKGMKKMAARRRLRQVRGQK